MRDPSGQSWLPQLLALPERFDGRVSETSADLGTIRRCAWDPEEEQLAPPRSLLEFLRRNPQSAKATEFLARLSEEEREAYVFEGLTSVDAT
jgi:hypothetical protein